jgi:sulfur carrier protein
VIVNGVARDIRAPQNVVELISILGIEPRGIAVAINGELASRSKWDVTVVQPSDVVEIVTAVAGG